MKSPRVELKGRRRRSPEECRRIVSDFLRSGETLWRFSQKVEIGYGSLRNWVKRYGAEAKKEQINSQSFVELPPSSIESAQIIASVRLPSGAELTVHTGCDTVLAQTLMNSLR